MGAWIEIKNESITSTSPKSLPLWERGLKWIVDFDYKEAFGVAPLVGAWIEICIVLHLLHHIIVAPLVGAWIEILSTSCFTKHSQSLPLWERGLKS